MKRCHAGTAESGSYILIVQMPLQEDRDCLGVPFSRKVTEYLMSSLGQLIGLSEQPGLLATGLRLNANLCLGLGEMKPDEAPIHFDFEMKWSPEIPLREDIPSRIELRDHHFPSIVRIGQKLTPSPSKDSHDVFVGKVLTLHGEPDEEGRMQGEATLVLLMDEQQIKAKVSFRSQFYPLVCDAHKLNQYIRISGILTEKPRCSELRDVSTFEVIG
jgi:hypothetical protein